MPPYTMPPPPAESPFYRRKMSFVAVVNGGTEPSNGAVTAPALYMPSGAMRSSSFSRRFLRTDS